KRVIGLNNPTFKIGDEYPHDVGVDQTPNLPFAIFEVTIKPRVLEGDRRLRRKHLQHHDARRGENARHQIVFKVENADEFSPIDQGRAENGTDAALNDVRIGSKRVLRQCIIKNYGLLGAYRIANERLWQGDCNWCAAFPHLHGYILSASS